MSCNGHDDAPLALCQDGYSMNYEDPGERLSGCATQRVRDTDRTDVVFVSRFPGSWTPALAPR